MKSISIANGEPILKAVMENGLATLQDNGIYGVEETELHLQAIPLIGMAWGISESEIKTAIDAITDSRNQVVNAASDSDIDGEEKPIPIGLEKLIDTIWGLFKTAIILERSEHRIAVLELATYIGEINDLRSTFTTTKPCA